MLPHKSPPSLSVDPARSIALFPLDIADNIADHLRHGVFWRGRNHHVHVIAHEMPLLDPAFLFVRPTGEIPPRDAFSIVRTTSYVGFRDEYHMVFALPLRTSYGLNSPFVHRGKSPFRVLGGSRLGVSAMDCRKCQTSTPSPAEPGASYLG